ncbi:TolC family protein [Variovorax terrae]|uniref:TolC family protein n=1 Tax=Variovorax terrae TaxID=2923278 RepID=A0A9X1VW22_9BURK|nr:TolC family protein [Variovorax terrae]MCJ0763094.1 TolC family protein [Variovorax terrae]
MTASSRRRAPAGLCLALAALGAQAEPMNFDAAWQRMQTGSDKLAAARSAVESKQLQGRGFKGLGGPTVSLTGAAYAYNANLTVNLDAVNQRLLQLDQRLPIPLQNLPIPLPVPQFPSRYTFNHHDTGNTSSVSAVWPIYAGGVSDAVRGFVTAQTSEAQADADQAGHELTTLLVQRYFGAQLAARAAALREAALQTIEQHDAAAQKMLDAGVISKLERLQARSALEEARRNAQKARDDAELSAVALTRTVKADERVSPTSPLFVLTQPVEPLQHFVEAALARHPGLAKVAAKKAEAEQLHAGQEALRRPQVFAFGQRELKSTNADWVAGVGVRWTLWDAIDRNALEASSLKQVEQAERIGAQARSDIALLVEKNWRALDQARRQYLAMQPGIALADEVLRLRVAGLREGTSTTLDLIDARVNLAKVQTERAQAAHDYAVALANLLESCGLSEEFSNYMARADVKVE